MRRKSHTSVATEMNSGTVTKKPAMKLRRSHCIMTRQDDGESKTGSASLWPSGRPREQPHDGHGRQSQPVVGEGVERVAGKVAQKEADRQVADHRRDAHPDQEQAGVVRR